MKLFIANLLAILAVTLLFVAISSASDPGDGDAGPAPLPTQLPAEPEPEEPAPTPSSLPSQPKPEAVPVNKPQPKLNDFQESSNKVAVNNNPPESKVTITVGEENGFQYKVNGHTYSRERIAVSGEYFNDAYHGDGYVRLFLVAEPSVGYYAVRPNGNRLDVYVQNYYYEEFYYEVYCPYPVRAYDLRHGQVNATAILLTGPSRSAVYGPDQKSAKYSSLVTSRKPSQDA